MNLLCQALYLLGGFLQVVSLYTFFACIFFFFSPFPSSDLALELGLACGNRRRPKVDAISVRGERDIRDIEMDDLRRQEEQLQLDAF